MRPHAHTPIMVRAHCAAHVKRYGPCPACQRATLATMRAQMAQAVGRQTENRPAAETTRERPAKGMTGKGSPVAPHTTAAHRPL